jgi:hypothetical protein
VDLRIRAMQQLAWLGFANDFEETRP